MLLAPESDAAVQANMEPRIHGSGTPMDWNAAPPAAATPSDKAVATGSRTSTPNGFHTFHSAATCTAPRAREPLTLTRRDARSHRRDRAALPDPTTGASPRPHSDDG